MNAITVIEAAPPPATLDAAWVLNLYATGEGMATLLRYDPETGDLFWRARPMAWFADERAAKSWNTRYAGKQGFTARKKHGYLHGAIFGRNFLAHRAAWAVVHGRWPENDIDHINGDPADNRLTNLRDVTSTGNHRNMSRARNNQSGVTGVHWCTTWNRWIARIGNKGKMRTIGNYSNFEEAVAARLQAERDLGFFEGHGKEPVGA